MRGRRGRRKILQESDEQSVDDMNTQQTSSGRNHRLTRVSNSQQKATETLVNGGDENDDDSDDDQALSQLVRSKRNFRELNAAI